MSFYYLILLIMTLVSSIFFTMPDDTFTGYIADTVQIDSKREFRNRLDFTLAEQGSSNNRYDKADNSITSKLVETPGKIQGFYSNAAGATVTQEELVEMLTEYDSNVQAYFNQCGVAPQNQADGNPNKLEGIDKWKTKFNDSVGTVHYLQWGENWSGMRHKLYMPGHNSTVQSSGCGTCALAIVYSTMLHRYITPAEVIIQESSYNKRYGVNKVFHTTSAGAGALSQNSELNLLIEDMKFNGASVLKAEHAVLEEQKLISVMEAGGMMIFVSGTVNGQGKANAPTWTNSGHWVVCREYDSSSNLFYFVDSANVNTSSPLDSRRTADPRTGSPFSIIKNANKNGDRVWYITPGDGYNAYLKSMK